MSSKGLFGLQVCVSEFFMGGILSSFSAPGSPFLLLPGRLPDSHPAVPHRNWHCALHFHPGWWEGRWEWWGEGLEAAEWLRGTIICPGLRVPAQRWEQQYVSWLGPRGGGTAKEPALPLWWPLPLLRQPHRDADTGGAGEREDLQHPTSRPWHTALWGSPCQWGASLEEGTLGSSDSQVFLEMLLLLLSLSPDPSEEALPLHHQHHMATAFLRISRELHPGMRDEEITSTVRGTEKEGSQELENPALGLPWWSSG